MPDRSSECCVLARINLTIGCFPDFFSSAFISLAVQFSKAKTFSHGDVVDNGLGRRVGLTLWQRFISEAMRATLAGLAGRQHVVKAESEFGDQ